MPNSAIDAVQQKLKWVNDLMEYSWKTLQELEPLDAPPSCVADHAECIGILKKIVNTENVMAAKTINIWWTNILLPVLQTNPDQELLPQQIERVLKDVELQLDRLGFGTQSELGKVEHLYSKLQVGLNRRKGGENSKKAIAEKFNAEYIKKIYDKADAQGQDGINAVAKDQKISEKTARTWLREAGSIPAAKPRPGKRKKVNQSR